MSDLTTPAANAIALPPSSAPLPAGASRSPGKSGFGRIMNETAFRPGARNPSGGSVRHDAATTGKELPEKEGPGKDGPEKEGHVDPALAWLFGPAAIPIPITPTTELKGATNGAPDPAPNLLTALNTGGATPEEMAGDELGGPDGSTSPPPMPQAPAPAAEADAALQPIRIALPQLRLSNDPAPNAQPSATTIPALFALAMMQEVGTRDDDRPSSPVPQTTALSQPATIGAVAPLGDAQRQTLDLGRPDWPQKMIDHIEALRDNANASDTSIRLRPEALGRVDIALRMQDGGAISVRFTAEQPTTHSLLVDAAPQLAAAAVARGIRLSGTSVDLAGQGDQRPNRQGEQAQPIVNRLGNTQGDDNQAAVNGRIA